MRHTPGLLFFLLIVGIAGTTPYAQQPSRKPARAGLLPFSLLLPDTPTVTGAPFTAEYEIQMQRPLEGGGSETWQSTTLVARDSSGRIRHELHDYVPESFTREPPLQTVILTDPVARLRHTLDPVRGTDDRQWFHVSHSSRFDFPNSPGQDLGTKTMSGLEVRGKRNSWTIFPHSIGAGQTDAVVDEIWYSDKEHLIAFEQQRDSAGEVFTIVMSRFDRSEPPATLFKVPPGYHLPSFMAGSGMWWLQPPSSRGQVKAGSGAWSVPSPDQTPNISGVW